MQSTIKNIALGFLCLVLAAIQTGCQKDTIAPPNQSVAFIKYYGHVAAQTGNDVIATSDGGFLLVGSTGSYTTLKEADAFIVKTDSGGNEMWSVSLGRAPGRGAPRTAFESFYIKYDEVAKTVAELPDGNYIVGVDRTYVRYASETDPVGRPLETKVVLYVLDAASGAVADGNVDGTELRNRSNGSTATNSFSETISDIYVDTSGGIIEYVVTGSTTNVNPKPNNSVTPNSLTDKSDIFTALLKEDYTIDWSVGNLAYGFQGSDYGVSIHKVPRGYMVCGIIDRNVAPNITDPYEFYPAVVAVIYNVSTGTPTEPDYYGGEGTFFDLGGSVHDEINNRITLFANVTNGANSITGGTSNSSFEGQLALLQIDEGTALQTIGNPADFGFTYFDPGQNASGSSPYEAASIDLLPQNKGFVLLATKKLRANSADLGSTICLTKVDADFKTATDANWPFFFGFETDNATFATSDVAGSVLALTSIEAGTSRSQLDGYLFTGSFGLGTNDMMGLVKLNAAGDFTSK